MAAELRDDPREPTGGQDDRCPFSRSFSADFADNPSCPAYQGATFTVTDTANRALGSALTCRHLAIGTHTRHRGRFYPRCGLGDPGARLRWAASMTPARLAVIRSLQEEFDELTRCDRDRLFAAKAELLAGGEADAAAMEALEIQLSTFLDRVEAFIAERSERLADVGLATDQLGDRLAEWSLAWLRSSQLHAPRLAAPASGSIAPDAAAFLGADLPGTPVVPGGGEVVAHAGDLVIERTATPAGLLLRGEIDVANSDAIATSLAEAMAAGGDVVVDFRDVLFCDLGGLRVLVRAAATAAPAQHILVANLPEHLDRAVGLVGWGDLPALLLLPTRPGEPSAGANG